MTRSALLCALLFALPACQRAPAAEASGAGSAAVKAEGTHAPGAHQHRNDPPSAGEASVEVLVNGKPASAWTAAKLASISPVQVANRAGEGRQGWSLKELARALVGPNARVVAIANDEADRVEIAQKDWFDPSRTLVMRPTHRGDFKVQWVATDGSPADAVIKHVARVELAE
jgi:hypothetical protein